MATATATAKTPRTAPAVPAQTLAGAFEGLCAALLASHDHDPVTQAQLHASLALYRQHQPVVAWRQVLHILEGVVGASIRTAQ